MHIPLSTAVALLSVLGGQQALAAPVPEEEPSTSLVTRNSGTGHSSSDPVEVVWKQNTKSQLAFEIDCYAILCQNKPRVLRYEGDSGKRAHTTGSGAWNNPSNPFKDPSHWNIQMPPGVQGYDTAEEYPFASTNEGGKGALLGPAPQNPVQSSQGNSFTQLITKNGLTPYDPRAANTAANGKNGKQKDPKRNWFKIKSFENVFKDGYCEALNKNDDSVCNPNKDVKGPDGYDVAKYIYKWENGKYRHVPKKKL